MAVTATQSRVAPIPAFESFQDYAYAELQAAHLPVQGECFNPDCCKLFNACVDTKIYCSPACKRAATAEMRRWGHKAAWPLLYWRVWKREADPDKARVVRAARRYLTHLQSEWFEQRVLRLGVTKERLGRNEP